MHLKSEHQCVHVLNLPRNPFRPLKRSKWCHNLNNEIHCTSLSTEATSPRLILFNPNPFCHYAGVVSLISILLSFNLPTSSISDHLCCSLFPGNNATKKISQNLVVVIFFFYRKECNLFIAILITNNGFHNKFSFSYVAHKLFCLMMFSKNSIENAMIEITDKYFLAITYTCKKSNRVTNGIW